MKEKIMKSLVVALLFLFTLYLFQYFSESRKKTSENVKEFIENTKITTYTLKALQKLYIQAFLYW